MIYGVRIGDKHSIDDWHLVMTQKVISPPEPQIYMLEIPQRDGLMDLTESLTGSVKYKNRIIEVIFAIKDKIDNYSIIFSDFQNYYHGKRMKLIFDDDMQFYYIGRISVDRTEVANKLGLITLKVECEPFKYDLNSSDEDWLWDSFDFESGIINELFNISIEGTKEVTIISSNRVTYPTIITDKDITVEYDGESYNLIKGENTMYEILLPKGENKLVFKGNAIITVKYRNGSL